MLNDNLKKWNEFVLGYQPNQFLQTWQWKEFQEQVGRQAFWFNFAVGQGLILQYQLPFNYSYFYCPRGPILTSWNQENLNLFFAEIKKMAIQNKAIFCRFEPPILSKFKSRSEQKFVTKWSAQCSFSEDGLPIESSIHKVSDVQPSQTTILDISPTEEEILNKMHYKTRYNIRLAQRHGVKIREAERKEIDVFLGLLGQTTQRDHFRAHCDDYYRHFFNLSLNHSDDLQVKLFFAEYKKEVLVANLMVYFGDTVFYVHGASADKLKNIMAPYLLHWEIIKGAKKAGYKFYDFWGIDENKWPGVTRFKLGFGGRTVKYPGTFDCIFNPTFYSFYRLAKKIRTGL